MPKQVTPQPMPTTGTAGPIKPNPITTFTNETLPSPRLGTMSVNPGKPAGGK